MPAGGCRARDRRVCGGVCQPLPRPLGPLFFVACGVFIAPVRFPARFSRRASGALLPGAVERMWGLGGRSGVGGRSLLLSVALFRRPLLSYRTAFRVWCIHSCVSRRAREAVLLKQLESPLIVKGPTKANPLTSAPWKRGQPILYYNVVQWITRLGGR